MEKDFEEHSLQDLLRLAAYAAETMRQATDNVSKGLALKVLQKVMDAYKERTEVTRKK